MVLGTDKGSGVSMEGFVDADYAGDLDKTRSLTGYLFRLNSCTINWKATLQNIVILLTIKVE